MLLGSSLPPGIVAVISRSTLALAPIALDGRAHHCRIGGVAERSNAAVLKTAEAARLPWVRIPPPPPILLTKSRSAHRFLHERADACLCGRSQLFQREGDRPQPAVVEVRRVAEADRRVPALELLRVLEEADDLAVLVIRGHPVPELRRKAGRAGFDDRVDPLRHGAIRVRHFGDLRLHGACVLLLARGRLPLFDELLHRGSFLVREYAALLVGRGADFGGPLRCLRWARSNPPQLVTATPRMADRRLARCNRLSRRSRRGLRTNHRTRPTAASPRA